MFSENFESFGRYFPFRIAFLPAQKVANAREAKEQAQARREEALRAEAARAKSQLALARCARNTAGGWCAFIRMPAAPALPGKLCR